MLNGVFAGISKFLRSLQDLAEEWMHAFSLLQVSALVTSDFVLSDSTFLVEGGHDGHV